MTPDKILIIRAQIKTGFSILLLLQIILTLAGCSDILFWLFLWYKNVFLKDESYYLPNNLSVFPLKKTNINKCFCKYRDRKENEKIDRWFSREMTSEKQRMTRLYLGFVTASDWPAMHDQSETLRRSR